MVRTSLPVGSRGPCVRSMRQAKQGTLEKLANISKIHNLSYDVFDSSSCNLRQFLKAKFKFHVGIVLCYYLIAEIDDFFTGADVI